METMSAQKSALATSPTPLFSLYEKMILLDYLSVKRSEAKFDEKTCLLWVIRLLKSFILDPHSDDTSQSSRYIAGSFFTDKTGMFSVLSAQSGEPVQLNQKLTGRPQILPKRLRRQLNQGQVPEMLAGDGFNPSSLEPRSRVEVCAITAAASPGGWVKYGRAQWRSIRRG